MFRFGTIDNTDWLRNGLPEISEVDKLNESYDIPQTYRLNPDKVLSFGVH